MATAEHHPPIGEAMAARRTMVVADLADGDLAASQFEMAILKLSPASNAPAQLARSAILNAVPGVGAFDAGLGASRGLCSTRSSSLWTNPARAGAANARRSRPSQPRRIQLACSGSKLPDATAQVAAGRALCFEKPLKGRVTCDRLWGEPSPRAQALVARRRPRERVSKPTPSSDQNSDPPPVPAAAAGPSAGSGGRTCGRRRG
jgi:hypothetical protein